MQITKTPLRVLIVEDSEDDALLLQGELRRGGYEPLAVRVDTPEAMRDALSRQEWDVILSDYIMPRFSGIAALNILRESGLDLPFIVISGNIGEDVAVEAMRAGAHDYIIKGRLARLVPAIEREIRDAFVRRERNQAELMLHKLYHAIQQSPASIVITSAAGAIEFVNPKFVQVSGYLPDEVIGKNPRILSAGETPPHLYRELWDTISSGEVWHGELKNRKKSGEPFWESVTISPVTSPEGGIIQYMALKIDITERKKLEDELRQAQKMEAIGRLAGGMAHDFKNISVIVTGYATLLKKQAVTETVMRFVDRIYNASERAINIANNLLAFSRKQAIKPKHVDLNQVIQGFEPILARLMGENQAMKLFCEPGGLPVMADTGQIEQVLMNLTVNARDAMPGGGVLSITTGTANIDEEFIVSHGFGIPGTYAFISATDTGTGMDENTRKKIFEPFFTTKDMGTGTGLGLSIVYGIVKQHKGFISVSSAPGKGTIFTVYLPLNKEKSGAEHKLEYEYPRGGTETVLLAEDNASQRFLTKTMLAEAGYTVIEAQNGDEAVKKFRKNKDTVRLLVLDLNMPVKDGKEALIEIRKINPDVQAIFISAYTEEIVAETGVLENGAEFISKPVTLEALLTRVRKLLDGTV